MDDNKNRNEWLKDNESFEEQLDKIHVEELGLGTPDDFFSKSKNDILDKVSQERKSKVVRLFRNKAMWFTAAGIALIVALSVLKPSSFSTVNKVPLVVADTIDQILNMDLNNDTFYLEDDILLASLFIDDSEIDDYVDNYIIEETIIDEYIDQFLLDYLSGERMLFY